MAKRNKDVGIGSKKKPKPKPQPEYYINCVVKILTQYRTSIRWVYYDHIYNKATVKVVGTKAHVSAISMVGTVWEMSKLVSSRGFVFAGERVNYEEYNIAHRQMLDYADRVMERLRGETTDKSYKMQLVIKRKRQLQNKIKRNIDTLTGKIVAYDMTDDTSRKIQILDEIVLILNKKYLRHFNINVIESMIRTYMQHGTFEPSTTTATTTAQVQDAQLPF